MNERSPQLDCWYVTGPTASGKTDIGIQLANRLDAEIISLDSMAVYQGMDIGTAKPSRQQRSAAPHHLLDILEPHEECSVSFYVDLAHQTIQAIRQRGREVVFVGGTPLYLKSLLRGIDPGPAANWRFRREVEEEAQREGLEALHHRLQQVDPVAAARLHRHDKRRIIRALEVYTLTGQPLSHRQMQFDEATPAEQCRVFVLQWPRPLLHQRINARVDAMFQKGLIEEVRALLAQSPSLGRTASQAVGYREVLQHLAGALDLDATIEAVKTRTRQFARRQETWYRSLSECRFISMENRSSEEVVDDILEQAAGSRQ